MKRLARKMRSLNFRGIALAVAAALLLLGAGATAAFAQCDTWTGFGGDGNWNTAGNWSSGVPNDPGTSACITLSGAAVSSVASDSVANLTLGSSDSLALNDVKGVGSGLLAVSGSSISNSGIISLNSIGDFVELQIENSATLSGGGTVTLSGGPGGAFLNTGNVNGATLINQDNTIQGTGQVGEGSLAVTNQGTINANVSAQSLVVSSGPQMTNTKTLEATGGGILELQNNFTNTGGTIEAVGSGSEVLLCNATITGGTLTDSSGGVLVSGGGSLCGGSIGATWNGVTNTGTYQMQDGTSTTISGTITNNGSIELNSASSGTDLLVPASATLAGTGTVTMSGPNALIIDNQIQGGSTLINQETIQGAGQFGQGNLTITNSGTINANISGAGITLSPDGGGFNNTGTLIVGSGSTLNVVNTFLNLVNGTLTGGTYNVTGTLQLPAGALVATNQAHITLTGASSKIIDTNNANVLASFATNSSTGSFTLAGQSLTTTANFTNSGALSISPGTLSVTGSFTQSSTGVLILSVGGTTGGTQFGQVKATGALSVGGLLDINLTGGFIPAVGASFTILSGSSRSGTFATVNEINININEHFVVVYNSTNVTLTVVKGGPPLADSPNDNVSFSGSGKADLAVWRPGTTTWYVLPNSGTSFSQVQGQPGDIPVAGDYDGDGKTDYALWRPSNGTFYVILSSTGVAITKQWGLSGDLPATRLAVQERRDKHIANFDGDRKADVAVWRPSTGTWYVIPSSNPATSTQQQWGLSGDVIVPGDYDGDGKTDFAVWRPSNGTFYVILSSTGKTVTQQWGLNGDIPVPRDYDGDEKTDYAVWRPSNGTWYILDSSTGKMTTTQWGVSGDVPVNKPTGQ